MGGTLAIPNLFTATVGDRPGADLDLDLTTIRDYINAREITIDILANRAAAGTKGAWFCASDVQGGTLYADNGAAWIQVASGVLVQAPSNTVSFLASYRLASL